MGRETMERYQGLLTCIDEKDKTASAVFRLACIVFTMLVWGEENSPIKAQYVLKVNEEYHRTN